MRRLFAFLLFALASTIVGGGAAPALAQTNKTVTLREGSSVVAARGTITFATADSVGVAYKTQAVEVTDANQGTAFVRLTTSDVTGTETVTVAVEISNDLATWYSLGNVATAVSSAATTTDTLTTVAGVSRVFKTARFFRLVATGASGNRRGVTLTWDAVLPKNTGAATAGASRVYSY